MLRKVDLSVMLIVDLTLIIVVEHSPFQFHGFAYAIQVISVPKLSFRLRTDRSSTATRLFLTSLKLCELLVCASLVPRPSEEEEERPGVYCMHALALLF